MAQVHVQVSDDKKEKWEAAVEESDRYRSLSDLVRLSVVRELSGEHDQQQTTTEESGKIGEVLEGINHIDSRIGDLEDRIRTVEADLFEDPEIGELSTEVFELLPDEDPDGRAWEEVRQYISDFETISVKPEIKQEIQILKAECGYRSYSKLLENELDLEGKLYDEK